MNPFNSIAEKQFPPAVTMWLGGQNRENKRQVHLMEQLIDTIAGRVASFIPSYPLLLSHSLSQDSGQLNMSQRAKTSHVEVKFNYR
ncbi:hypothetical protein Bpfe_023430 [Biomphalaria pfeifferi]|uniref:Uncharacterized protein n=1 Tax=Biomphalaria pfeifferi TaxID=112525 RepID=A0AAD8B319_BIOPF|nr:hypothetical protein Bpfe_023430 [Biomphalaria pfeifferi]